MTDKESIYAHVVCYHSDSDNKIPVCTHSYHVITISKNKTNKIFSFNLFEIEVSIVTFDGVVQSELSGVLLLSTPMLDFVIAYIYTFILAWLLNNT